jgi:hypothetical protein
MYFCEREGCYSEFAHCAHGAARDAACLKEYQTREEPRCVQSRAAHRRRGKWTVRYAHAKAAGARTQSEKRVR